MPLFGLSDLETYLQVTAGSLNEVAVEQARVRAENYLRLALGVEFESASREFTGTVPASRTFQRLARPLTAVASVTARGVALAEGTDWERTADGVSCPAGFGRVATTATIETVDDWCTLAIAYTAGWADPPTELVDWGMFLAASAYRSSPVQGITQQVAGPFSLAVDPTVAREGLSLPKDALRSLQAKFGAGRRAHASVLIR